MWKIQSSDGVNEFDVSSLLLFLDLSKNIRFDKTKKERKKAKEQGKFYQNDDYIQKAATKNYVNQFETQKKVSKRTTRQNKSCFSSFHFQLLLLLLLFFRIVDL